MYFPNVFLIWICSTHLRPIDIHGNGSLFHIVSIIVCNVFLQSFRAYLFPMHSIYLYIFLLFEFSNSRNGYYTTLSLPRMLLVCLFFLRVFPQAGKLNRVDAIRSHSVSDRSMLIIMLSRRCLPVINISNLNFSVYLKQIRLKTQSFTSSSPHSSLSCSFFFFPFQKNGKFKLLLLSYPFQTFPFFRPPRFFFFFFVFFIAFCFKNSCSNWPSTAENAGYKLPFSRKYNRFSTFNETVSMVKWMRRRGKM